MAFLDSYSKIKYKIIIIVLIISTIAILVGQAISLFFTITTSRNQLANSAVMDARLVGEYCVAPLTFNDNEGIDEVLSKLKSNPDISLVYIYDENNKLVTTYYNLYSNDEISPHYPVGSEKSGFIDDNFHVSHIINYEGINYGSIYLIASTQNLSRILTNNIILLIISFITLFFLSYILAGILQKVISRPIVELTAKTKQISQIGDYSVRVEKSNKDEIGNLYDNFNLMLEQIYLKDKARAEAEEIIKKERDKAKDYLDIATVTIMALDADANIIQVNRKGCELLEIIDEKDVIGENWYDLFALPEEKESGKRKYKKLIEEAIPNNNITEEEIITLEGKRKLIAWQDVFLRDDYGNVVGMLGSAEDITYRKAREIELIRLSNAVDQSASGILIMNLEWEIEYANKSFTKITNYEQNDILGKTPMVFIYKTKFSEENDIIQRIKNIVEAGKTWHEEFHSRKKTGEEFWVSVITSPITDSEGKIINYISIYNDISSKKNQDLIIKATNQKLESVVENSPLGIFHFNGYGEITLTNKAFCNLLESDRNTLLGFNILESIDNQELRNSFEDCLSGVKSNFTGTFINKKTNNELSVKVIFTPLSMDNNGRHNGFCMVEDITKRLKLEKMQRDRDAAEASNKAKGEFLARMSHEIRTPMNAIIGLSNLALKTDLNNRQLDYLQKILNSGEHLLGIINDILDFSKIEAGKISLEKTKFKFETILRDLSALITMKAQEKGLEFSFVIDPDVPYDLIGDPLRLSQILTNLANNAVKFTEKGEVNIIVSVLNSKANNVELKFIVEDTGIGLTKSQIAELFRSFSQADISTSRKYGGTGLGLAISKRFVELMGGNIWVESVPDKGSKFIFTAIFETQVSKSNTPKAVLDGFRILICDDNLTTLQFFSAVLKMFNVEVKAVSSGFDAIKAIEEEVLNPYDIVIMDWMMPKMDGITTIEKIKKSPHIVKQPVFIILTAYGKDKTLHDKVKDLNIEGFAEKPITRSSLLDTIMSAVSTNSELNQSIYPDFEVDENIENILGSRILLAEDNEINQQVAVELLEYEGFEVETAINGREVLELLSTSEEQLSYDLILMDLQMPVMDGFEAVKKIRKINKYDKIPIVAMTADAMAGVAEKCFNIGMQDFLTKPISPEHLFKCLVKWIPSQENNTTNQKKKKTKTYESEIIIPDFININIKDGLSRIGNNKRAYVKLLNRFYENYLNFGENSIKYLKANNKEQLKRLIHTLKGVSGNIGAINLHNKIIDFEPLINKSTEHSEHLLDEICTDLNKILSEIKSGLIKDKPERKKPNYKLEKVKPDILLALNKLMKYLKDSDAKAINIMEELEKYSEIIFNFKEIHHLIKQYDFDEAIILLQETIKHIENE